MTVGVGGSNQVEELKKLQNMTADIAGIEQKEFRARLAKAQEIMQESGIGALYLNAGTNMLYFTGTAWRASERMVGAVLCADGTLFYIAPHFEVSTLNDFMVIEAEVHSWQEHESPYALFADLAKQHGFEASKIGLDEGAPFFLFDGLRKMLPNAEFVDGAIVSAPCRRCKSPHELALMQRAKDMTLEVHKAAARILRKGISTTEVTAFINEAHKAVGAAGSTFCIVLFGEATAYPHGVKHPQILKDGDMVLIDTGCAVHGYNSDITRTYVFGEPNERQREVWEAEKAAQAAAFEAAKIGTRCGDVDLAARKILEQRGFGPEYETPGLPHRTGHGIGLDIHEWPYLVWSDDTPLAAGMCFSNEPMICVYGEFGVRLEDHFYMTEKGPKWFTLPSHSIDDPFGYNAGR